MKSNDPQIIFMSSMAAKTSINWESIYWATKAGITNFSNILRNELGVKIRISTIHSWGVNTFGADESIPLLKPTDIANCVNFIINTPRPVCIESIDLSHQNQRRWWNAPWSN
jgi:NADP-dependent 3-hydroxy acid dehydrogenase YdfG